KNLTVPSTVPLVPVRTAWSVTDSPLLMAATSWPFCWTWVWMSGVTQNENLPRAKSDSVASTGLRGPRLGQERREAAGVEAEAGEVQPALEERSRRELARGSVAAVVRPGRRLGVAVGRAAGVVVGLGPALDAGRDGLQRPVDVAAAADPLVDVE